jgi:hypothetical protein
MGVIAYGYTTGSHRLLFTPDNITMLLAEVEQSRDGSDGGDGHEFRQRLR